MQSHVSSYICACENRRVESLLETNYLDVLVADQIVLQTDDTYCCFLTRMVRNLTSTCRSASALEKRIFKILRCFFGSVSSLMLDFSNRLESNNSLHRRVKLIYRENNFSKLFETAELAQRAYTQSKKRPLTPEASSDQNIKYTLTKNSLPYGVFKGLETKEIAGEIGGYLIGLISGLNFAPAVVPAVCSVRQAQNQQKKTAGTFTAYCHESYSVDSILKLNKTIHRGALESISKQTLDYLCLYHFIMGSEDAHMGNSLVRFKPKNNLAGSSEIEVADIQEVDHEAIMPPPGSQTQRLRSLGDMCTMRIWWLGLQKAATPFTKESLQYLLQIESSDFYCLSDKFRIFSKERINGLIARITTMKQVAYLELRKKNIKLTPQQLFAELTNNHPSIALACEVYSDPVEAYNQIGAQSVDQLTKLAQQQVSAVSF